MSKCYSILFDFRIPPVETSKYIENALPINHPRKVVQNRDKTASLKMAQTIQEKLKALDEIEMEIISAVQGAGQVLQEMSKEQIPQRNLEAQSVQFMRSLNTIESKLIGTINYLTRVSTGQEHERSVYGDGAPKECQLALDSMEHVRNRLHELEESNARYEHVMQQKLQQQQAQQAAAEQQQQQQAEQLADEAAGGIDSPMDQH